MQLLIFQHSDVGIYSSSFSGLPVRVRTQTDLTGLQIIDEYLSAIVQAGLLNGFTLCHCPARPDNPVSLIV